MAHDSSNGASKSGVLMKFVKIESRLVQNPQPRLGKCSLNIVVLRENENQNKVVNEHRNILLAKSI